MKKLWYISIITAIISFGFTVAVKDPAPAYSKLFFELNVNKGDKLGNIFSRTISYKGDGFPEISFSISGTGIYTVMDNNPENTVFDAIFRYDGRPESKGTNIISNGGRTITYKGNSSVNTDGSGLTFNPLIWGTPPAKIKTGDTWQVNIPQAWELGGAGMQKITVMEMDGRNHIVRLKREGSSEGFYDNDSRQIIIKKDGKSLKMDEAPAHHTG